MVEDDCVLLLSTSRPPGIALSVIREAELFEMVLVREQHHTRWLVSCFNFFRRFSSPAMPRTPKPWSIY